MIKNETLDKLLPELHKIEMNIMHQNKVDQKMQGKDFFQPFPRNYFSLWANMSERITTPGHGKKFSLFQLIL